MKKVRNYFTLEERIEILQKKGSLFSVEEILNTLSGKGQSLILLLLSLPFCLTLQFPGLSTPFGLMVAFIGLRMAFGKRIWLPKSFLAKKIKPQILQKIAGKSLLLLKKMQPWVDCRLMWFCHHYAFRIINSILISLMGIFLALPLPIPFSNLLAAWSIFFIGFGILEDDGLFVLVGYLISLLTFSFFAAIIWGSDLILFHS
jgi:hypothetical protein